jgi:hypothetical protein
LRYIHHFGGKTHPRLLGARDVEHFLSHLASVGKVAASTQRQALNALVFLYREVLDISLEGKIARKRSQGTTSALLSACSHTVCIALRPLSRICRTL